MTWETDLGASTDAGASIASASRERVAEIVPAGDDPFATRLRRKAVHATGDPTARHRLAIDDGARATLDALRDGAPIVVDVAMVAAGITDRAPHGPVRTAVEAGADAPADRTRTATGIDRLAADGALDDALVVVGTAPTGALAVADRIESGVRPAAVIATPVGFVDAARSRRRVRAVGADGDVPTITTYGRRGGCGLAAALANECCHAADD
ncbi:MAG: precorrin-8X methylmutase [Halococcoides sp.]